MVATVGGYVLPRGVSSRGELSARTSASGRARRALVLGSNPTVEEVKATAPAVRSTVAHPSTRLFSTTASGTKVAQMLRAGLAPSEAVFGIGIVRADVGGANRRLLRSLNGGNVEQYSEAIEKSMALAITDIEQKARNYGQLVVGCRTNVVFERILAAGAETATRITGTAIRHFTTPSQETPLQMLNLR